MDTQEIETKTGDSIISQQKTLKIIYQRGKYEAIQTRISFEPITIIEGETEF